MLPPAWLDAVDDPGSVLFCRATQQSFLRLLSSAAVLAPYGVPPLSNREAWRAYQALLGDDRIVLQAHEPAGIEARWKGLGARGSPSPKLWMDAYLAAFALSGRQRMVTTDGGFRQFPGLDLIVIGEG